ncbi:MAG: replication initiator protein [Microviridae sp.]|nr:MAG: replication initiator protein [Microviridae sp.]
MCLYPKLIDNPKYKPNKKNGGKPPIMIDERVRYVPIGCQKCKECYKKKANEWRVRLKEEIKNKEHGKAWFITLTTSTEGLKEIDDKVDKKYTGYDRDNAIATKAVRLWLERWRKHKGKSIRHWLITEIGEGATEHMHIHGIIWTNEQFEDIRSTWKYGYVYPREWEIKKNYVNSKSVNYIIKYVTQLDKRHIYYKSIIMTSSGIGNKYKKPTGDIQTDKYRTEQGYKITLPIYYRNKMYTDEEREKLWIEKLNEPYRWVAGKKVKSNDTETINKLLEQARVIDKKDGYIGGDLDYIEEEYQNKLRDLIRLKRFAQITKNN